MKLSSNPFDSIPQPFEIPELTSAVIQDQVPQLNTTWDIATQLATIEGKPFNRSYSILDFPEEDSRIDEVLLSDYSEEYEGTNYYLVSSYFYETKYSSGVDFSQLSQDFLRWKQVKYKYRQELIYANTLIQTEVWDRPPDIRGNEPIPSEDEEPLYYQKLQSPTKRDPYVLSLFVGEALKASVATFPLSSPVRVRLKSNSDDSNSIQVTDLQNILLTKPYLEIEFLNVDNGIWETEFRIPAIDATHKKVSISFYGKYKWKTFAPVGSEELPTLIHPLSSSIETRLKPPGLDYFPDNFWNSNSNLTPFEQFNTRVGILPQWI